MALSDLGLDYEPRRRAAQQQRAATLAQNELTRFLAKQRGTRQMSELDRGMSRGVEGVASAYGKRGLRNSGIMGEGLGEYARNWQMNRNDMMQALADKLNELNLSDVQANASYEDVAAELELQKQRDILATASSLAGMRPFLGG
ncbi:MAG: hypothetical protein EBZ16_04910 [Flavobacteriia bacterium]|jgi:hypothetical protein|nr:hypothetical protein [Flavobacteriia bacterium]NDA28719.1 hypothetical protein [Flavobacteriia bacterium]NDD80891.1 hypothetical protein [Flavobacteriia bacterium]